MAPPYVFLFSPIDRSEVNVAMHVPVAVSARHIHLSYEDLAILFGENYELKPLKNLSQPGQFASTDTVVIKTEKSEFATVRIVGPVRRRTQIEISRTDAIHLGIKVPVRISGDLLNSPGITVVGPNGSLVMNEGVIIAARHIHMTPEIAAQLGVKERQSMYVRLNGPRPITLERVHARISPLFTLEMHIDTDDANSVGIDTGSIGEIVAVHPYSHEFS
jgi:putative phosphotransacetylase